MKEKFFSIIEKPLTWIILFSVMAITAAVQNYYLGTKITEGVVHTHYNNYVIFKYSFRHLIEGRDLYIFNGIEHNDLYKYSPAFALFFGFFNLFPDLPGLIIWDLLNFLIVAVGVYLLPISSRQKGIALLILTIELFTSVQGTQSNGLIAGLIILGFALLEKRNYAIATLLIVFSVYVKLFGFVAFSLCLFYPDRTRMFLWSALWFIIFAFIPLVVIDWPQLVLLYKSWWATLSDDIATNYGFSVLGGIKLWLGITANKFIVLMAGVVLFCIPLLKISLYKNVRFRMLMLASVLLWVILFNHRSESTTVVIAVVGVALWFVNSPFNKINTGLVIFTILLTSLSSSELIPSGIRRDIVYPYILKIVPCIAVWIKLSWDLITFKPKQAVLA